MSKEKTAIQILIEEIESLSDKLQPNTHAKRIYLGLRDKIINMNLLQKEQEQIEMAFECGYGEGCYQGSIIDHNKSHKEYYQSKYGGENG